MSRKNAAMQDYILISRVAHVIERSGLAMAGAMCGTFVGAQLAKANVALLESVGFIASMILIGMIAFYVGIDVPRPSARPASERESVDAVEVLSAVGTFLASVAALISVFSIVFDEAPQRLWEFVVGSWWLGGVAMQVAAGSIGRLRANARVARQTTDGRQTR
jgi:hypothetical protein